MATSISLPSTLRFRLSSLVVVLVLAATVIVTVLALMLAERDMKEVIGGQQYALMSGAAAHMDEHLAGKKAAGDISAVIAYSPTGAIFYPVERRSVFAGIRTAF